MHLARAPNFEQQPTKLHLAHSANPASSAEALLRKVALLLRGLVEFDAIALYLPGSKPDFVQPVVWDRGALVSDLSETAKAGSAVGWVWEHQRPLLISDHAAEERFSSPGPLAHRNVACSCAVPIVVRGRSAGTLEVGRAPVRSYDSAELELLERLAGILAVALDRTRPDPIPSSLEAETLLALETILASSPGIAQALPEISRCLRDVVPHDAAWMRVVRPGQGHLSSYLFDPASERFMQKPDVALGKSLSAVVLREGRARAYSYKDLQLLSRYDGIKQTLENGDRSVCVLPLATPSGETGVLWLAARQESACRKFDVQLFEQLASPAAIEQFEWASRARRRSERAPVLEQINALLLAHERALDALPGIFELLQRVLPHQYATFELHDKKRELSVRRIFAFSGGVPALTDNAAPLPATPGGCVLQHGQPMVLEDGNLDIFKDPLLAKARERGVRCLCLAPLLREGRAYGVLLLGSSRPRAFRQEDMLFLAEVASRVALALPVSRADWELRLLESDLKENLDLKKVPRDFAEFVGSSERLIESLRQVAVVAASSATVLVLGETGTGKDLIATAIHRASGRRDQPMIKLNCAAIPTGLLESELFGHERGAFTGAISQKIGRMEMAHHGTLFLDEIGDIPLELQPKLLRVLQDQEFERLGGTRTIKVDFRLIAATNHDLYQAVLNGRFRSDLYYRLNVFPIRMPALRERREDIPELVWHFVRKFEKRLGTKIEFIADKTMGELIMWSWPGNIRELGNLIERSVLLSRAGELNVPVAELHRTGEKTQAAGSFEDNEREHILRVLRETGGAISGPAGAAARLGLKRTTLQSKMQRLGISRSSHWKS